ncbi:hypothetical protein NliqN6_2098 [Naganishia liquefaciens]|uniref:TFIIS N-terminal domain-containing protein n=1 Tax=Naganishia liquefaciens TaxID=104408 RepID=A0A8H3TQS1_9TREE|nr:hypothetical protein NliqN6_2098 [Naganishia liquefaciens]
MPEDFPIMADLEKPAADTQQEPNAVAMTEVGGTDPPVGPAIVPDRDHEAVDPEQGNVQEAASKKEAQDVNGAVPEEVQQITEVAFNAEEPVVEQGDLVEQAAAMDDDIPEQAPKETNDESLLDQGSKSESETPQNTEPTIDTQEQENTQAGEVEKDKQDDQMEVVQDESLSIGDRDQKSNEIATEDATEDATKDPAGDAAEAADDSGTNDLFQSDDEGEQTTRTPKAADDDSEIDSITPSRPTTSAEESGRGVQEEEDDEEDEVAPLRKKQRRESTGASDADNENYSREVDGERNEREALRDEREEEERLAEPDENDEALVRKRALDARIEAIGKAGKRKRSRKKDDSEDLGLDRQIEEMTTMMDNAIREDIQSNKSKRPALRKTQILTRVISVLQNASLQQSILESNDFLSTLRRFIEPMEDGSLPSLTIQKGILFQLGRLEGLEVIHLRNSGLGKVVNFYTRCKRCQPEIIRQANLLIDRWSKPILDNGSNARASARARAEAERDDDQDRRIQGGDRGDGASDGDQSRNDKRKVHRTGELLRARVMAGASDDSNKGKGTRLPNVIGHAYAVAPQARRSAKGPEEQALEEARQRENERINRFKKKAMQASR